MKVAKTVKSIAPLLIIVFALIITAIMISSRKPPEKKEVEEKTLLVKAEPIISKDINFTIRSQGNVAPKNKTSLSTQVSGVVTFISPVFEEGGMFFKDDILFSIEKADYQTELLLAEAELAQAEASLQEELARGKVAEKEWRGINSVIPPELGLRKPQLAKEKANLKAAKAKLARAQRQLERTDIRAPYDGIVISRMADMGQFVSVGSNVGEVYSTATAEVRLPLTDNDMAFIELEQGVVGNTSVTISANVGGKSASWLGKLLRTEGVMDANNRLVYATVEVADPYQRTSELGNPILRFGQFVQAEFAGAQFKSLVVVPRSLLRLDNTVLVVTPENTIAIRKVDVVRSEVDFVYISSGFENTDQLVLSAVPNPYNGLKVRFLSDKNESEPQDAVNAESK